MSISSDPPPWTFHCISARTSSSPPKIERSWRRRSKPTAKLLPRAGELLSLFARDIRPIIGGRPSECAGLPAPSKPRQAAALRRLSILLQLEQNLIHGRGRLL